MCALPSGLVVFALTSRSSQPLRFVSAVTGEIAERTAFIEKMRKLGQGKQFEHIIAREIQEVRPAAPCLRLCCLPHAAGPVTEDCGVAKAGGGGEVMTTSREFNHHGLVCTTSTEATGTCARWAQGRTR